MSRGLKRFGDARFAVTMRTDVHGCTTSGWLGGRPTLASTRHPSLTSAGMLTVQPHLFIEKAAYPLVLSLRHLLVTISSVVMKELGRFCCDTRRGSYARMSLELPT